MYNNNKLFVSDNNLVYTKIKVLDIPPSRVGAKLVDLYRKDLTQKEEFEKTELLKFAKDYYKKKSQNWGQF